MIRVLFSIAFLTSIYAFVLASFHPWDLVTGAVFSGVLLFVFRDFVFGGMPKPSPGFFGKVAALPLFLAASVWDIVKGTWGVALVALHLRPLERPGIVAVPIGERTPVGLAVSAIETTLSPGTYLVDVDLERGVWLIHALDATDPEAVRRDRQEFYERYQRRVFP
ncbi:MAG: Na+/H+ antiporter subunit E [Rubrobacteraceae bacterium]